MSNPFEQLAAALEEAFPTACTINVKIVQPKPSREFLTIKQVAEKLQLSERSVARMVERGLVVSKVGKAVRIRPEDLARYLEDQETVFD